MFKYIVVDRSIQGSDVKLVFVDLCAYYAGHACGFCTSTNMNVLFAIYLVC